MQSRLDIQGRKSSVDNVWLKCDPRSLPPKSSYDRSIKIRYDLLNSNVPRPSMHFLSQSQAFLGFWILFSFPSTRNENCIDGEVHSETKEDERLDEGVLVYESE
jgi:hypothetical protein